MDRWSERHLGEIRSVGGEGGRRWTGASWLLRITFICGAWAKWKSCDAVTEKLTNAESTVDALTVRVSSAQQTREQFQLAEDELGLVRRIANYRMLFGEPMPKWLWLCFCL